MTSAADGTRHHTSALASRTEKAVWCLLVIIVIAGLLSTAARNNSVKQYKVCYLSALR